MSDFQSLNKSVIPHYCFSRGSLVTPQEHFIAFLRPSANANGCVDYRRHQPQERLLPFLRPWRYYFIPTGAKYSDIALVGINHSTPVRMYCYQNKSSSVTSLCTMSLWEFCLIPFVVIKVKRTDFLVCVSVRKASSRAESFCSSASEISNLSLLYFISQRDPAVPEVFQRCDEPGLRRVHPRQFVNEYHFLPFRQRFQIARKLKECQDPVFLNIQSPRT